tara:strand:- start:1192 stop:1452 length:261 start_codon:yes stop_codon:yes gene_type:complete
MFIKKGAYVISALFQSSISDRHDELRRDSIADGLEAALVVAEQQSYRYLQKTSHIQHITFCFSLTEGILHCHKEDNIMYFLICVES